MTSSPYHHGNLREALVDAAVDVVRDGGPEALALRELGRRLGVSHNAIYRHFADREALVDLVAERALGAMVDLVHRRLSRVAETDPVSLARRRLMEIGEGYVEFALTESGLFRLLFTAYPEPPSTKGAHDSRAPGDDPYAMLNAALDDLVAVGFLAPGDRVGADVTCWAAVHGFAVLNIEGPLRGLTQDERQATLSGLLLAIDRGLGAGGDWPALVTTRGPV